MGYFGNYALAYASEHGERYLRPFYRHSVSRSHCANAYRVVVGAQVAHYADAPYPCEYREILPQRAFKTCSLYLAPEYVVTLAEYVQLLLCYVSDNSYRKPGPGKRLTPNKVCRYAQALAERTHLILEKRF